MFVRKPRVHRFEGHHSNAVINRPGGLFVDHNGFAAPDRQRVATVEFLDIEPPRARRDFGRMDGVPAALLPLPGEGRLVIVRFDDRTDSFVRFHVLRLDPIGDYLGRRRGQRVVKVLSATFSANGPCSSLWQAAVCSLIHVGLHPLAAPFFAPLGETGTSETITTL